MDHETQDLIVELTRWRQSNHPPTPLPERLWSRAAELASKKGIAATAKALHLGHAALKRRLDQGRYSQAADFVEFLQPPLSNRAGAECVLEVQSSRGARLRIEGARMNAVELASLVRLFAD